MNSTHLQNAADATLDVIPLGMIDPMALEVVAANIQAISGLFTCVRPPRPWPEYAFIATRNQFDASKILKALSEENDGAPFKLGIIQEDLCLPILTYIYGESQLGGKAAVISLCRLFGDKPDILYERVAKVGIHEVGHLIGLEHCRAIDCLMRFSKQIDQLDRLPMHFCSACEYEISRRVRRMMKNGRLPASQT